MTTGSIDYISSMLFSCFDMSTTSIAGVDVSGKERFFI